MIKHAVFPSVALLFLATPSQADTLGPATFSRASSATLIAGGGGSFNWLNVINAPVSMTQALTAAPLQDMGYANATSGTVLEYTFPAGITNGPGPDIVVFDLHYDVGFYNVSTDFDGFAAAGAVGGWANTGIGGSYWYDGAGPYGADVWWGTMDLSSVGVPVGGVVYAFRTIATNEATDPAGAGSLGATEVCDGIDNNGDGVVDEGFPDTDADGVADCVDICPGYNDTLDMDGDGVPDGCDVCAGSSDLVDTDGDTVPDGCDICPGGDDGLDADGDGVADFCDLCPGYDDNLDVDGDGIPDGCDGCVSPLDSDGDTVPDDCDICPGGDDLVDSDADMVPDYCDICPGYDDTLDTDGDTVPEGCDVCPGEDDLADADADALPDACDPCPAQAFETDLDGDGDWSCTDCDDSDALLNTFDADGDGDSTCDGDCNDLDPLVGQGAAEAANGIDDDCDGIVDETTEWYDDDGDGYADDGGDCDDGDYGIFPGAIEICDGLDNDCDGVIDEETECFDDDGDGFCEGPVCADASLPGDCNDGDANANPLEAEIFDNGVDDDCDPGTVDGFFDVDGDGYSPEGGDCDPNDTDTYPGAPELADGVDNDCDGVIDEGTDQYDDDGDGASEVDGDCNDDDPAIFPGADDNENGIDDDCDGIVDEDSPNTDDDGDGYSEVDGDCNDDNLEVSPAQVEIVNGVDDDCDGAIDEGFEDLDGDGYTEADGDCDDNNGWVNPELHDFCGDELDNNCDGQIDEDCDGVITDAKPTESGCQCGATGAPTGAIPVLALLLVLIGGVLRRRADAGAAAGLGPSSRG